jgi:hypothetical protein
MTFRDFINKTLTLSDVISMRFNITDIQFQNLELDNKEKLVVLHDDRMVFSFKNATGNFGWSYRYITDPPLLADIGEFDLDIEPVNFKVDFDSAYNDGILDVLIN